MSSLQTRLSDLISAIGTDVKALYAQVGTPIQTFVGAYVYRSTGTVDGVQTYNSEVWDSDAFHDSVTNTSRLTIPAGYTNAKFRISAWGRFNSANPSNPNVKIYKNGAIYGGRHTELYVDGGHYLAFSISMDVEGSTGDYFEVYASNGSGVLGNVPDNESGNGFQIHLIGGAKGDIGATGDTGPKGDQGDPGVVTVYEQTTEPVGAINGDLWVDTDSSIVSPPVIIGSGVTEIMTISQAAYDALSPPNSTTLYIITS